MGNESQSSWLLVGLGNPGKTYERNRHNIGFIFLDEFLSRKYPGIVFRAKFKGLFGTITGANFFALKPQTFMNLSGQSVSEAAQFYKIQPEHVVILHDDLDLALGTLKVSQGGGAAGHNGLKSIESSLGSKNTVRIRIGIGHPRTLGIPRAVQDYVLESFSTEDLRLLSEDVFPKIETALQWILKDDVLRAMTEANRREK